MRIDDTDPDELDDDDLEGDGHRSEFRRRKWWMLAAAAAVVAGGVATFVVTRDDDDEIADDASTTVAVTDTEVEDTGPDIDVAGPDLNGFPDYGSDYQGPQLELLAQRVTDAGIRISLQDTGDWGQFRGDDVFIIDEGSGAIIAPPDTIAPVPGQPGDWIPPGWCIPVGGFRLTMSFKDAIGISNGSRYTEPRNGLNVTLFSSGYAEGSTFRVLVLQLGDDVLQATATWDDGSTDTAPAVKGWAVLATPGEPSGKFDITLQTADGERSITWEALPREGDLDWQKGCNPPPPELPPPGEQPDDAEAAKQEISDGFELLWNNKDVPFEEKGEQLLEDTTGVQDAIDSALGGSVGETAQSAVHILNDIVFVSPSEAWFNYDITTDVTDFTNRFGIAYLIDGTWKFSRAVICQDLSLAGAQCFPFVDQILPPGASGNIDKPVPFPGG